MAQDDVRVDVVLEVGKTRVFAIARDWPGWCRSGPDEVAALRALLEVGSRYQKALEVSQVGFTAPQDLSNLVVVERLKGNATTDFGAPSLAWPDDGRPISQLEMDQFQKLLQACWIEFDTAIQAAAGISLQKGPRGGGRDLTKIIEHVYDVDVAYLKSLGGKPKPGDHADPGQALAQIRQEILITLIAAARGEVPERGPRGGIRWTPRYFVRRLAWHELDHAWEILSRASA